MVPGRVLQEVVGGGVQQAQLMPPRDPCPSLLPLLSVPVWREGLAPCPAWVAPEESRDPA